MGILEGKFDSDGAVRVRKSNCIANYVENCATIHLPIGFDFGARQMTAPMELKLESLQSYLLLVDIKEFPNDTLDLFWRFEFFLQNHVLLLETFSI